MNRLKFNNFIKKILVMVLVIFIINEPLIAYARPGGGSGGSSSGGGGGTSSSSSSSGSHYGGSNYRGRNSNLGDIIIFGIVACSASAGVFILKVKLGKKKTESIAAIKDLSKSDDNWDYKEIKKDIEEAFYKIGIAWMERNQDLAREYISDKLYDKHKSQTEWMMVRKEKNILENMTLLGAKPIGLKDCEGIDNDILWVHMKAKSIDYTINEETNEVIEGQDNKSVRYQEYWKFIRKEDRWVLDEIRQIDDIDDLNFFKIEVQNKKK